MNMINESNITNSERLYRNFCGLVSVYKPNVDLATIQVEKTPKGNWRVYDADGKKICLVSRAVLNDELVDERKIRKCDCAKG